MGGYDVRYRQICDNRHNLTPLLLPAGNQLVISIVFSKVLANEGKCRVGSYCCYL